MTNRTDLLPPPFIMARWRAEGFSPAEIRQMADTWIRDARRALEQVVTDPKRGAGCPQPVKLAPIPTIPRRFRLRRERVNRRGRKLAYKKALELVARIDEGLSRGVVHYRTRGGVLLTTLDEVIEAILRDNLAKPEVVHCFPGKH